MALHSISRVDQIFSSYQRILFAVMVVGYDIMAATIVALIQDIHFTATNLNKMD